MDIGVVLEALVDQPLEQALTFVRDEAPEISAVEIGVGGYAPIGHCDMHALLDDKDARTSWSDLVASFGVRVSALNAWGNPLHPDEEVALRHRHDLIDAVHLATELGVPRVIALGGCPAGERGDRAPHFAAGGWLPYLEGAWERQWEDCIAECWSAIGKAAEAENPELKICLELHPGTVVYNVDTFERVAALSPAIAANVDPSHMFWMQMDPLAVVKRLGRAVGYAHAKDTSFNKEELGLNGVMDARWPANPATLAWNFSLPGYGHGRGWWQDFVEALGTTSATTLSIECEDPFVVPREGIAEAASFLRTCGAGGRVLR